MLAEYRGNDIGIHSLGPEAPDHGIGQSREMAAHQVGLVRFPGTRGAEVPACRLRNETGAGLVHPFAQALDVVRWSKGPVVEEVLVNPVGNQDAEIPAPKAAFHPRHDAERTGMSGLARAGAAKVAIRILDHELEGDVVDGGANGPEFTLGVATHPHEHEVDDVGHIDVIRSVVEGIGSCHQ